MLLLTLLGRHGVGALAVLREERGSLRVGRLGESASGLREATRGLLEAGTGWRTVLAPLQMMLALPSWSSSGNQLTLHFSGRPLTW
jgi:hypothetical protein